MVAVLYARRDTVYRSMPEVRDVYDIDRDARTYAGPFPVVAHPPCRAWGRLRHFARPVAGEMDLARHAVSVVRRYGGILEHPVGSLLWRDQGLPPPGAGYDAFGGWSFGAPQFWWGHEAYKLSVFYVCGVRVMDMPCMPFALGDAPKVLETRKKTGPKRPSLSKSDRERTPLRLASWLVEVASLCAPAPPNSSPAKPLPRT